MLSEISVAASVMLDDVVVEYSVLNDDEVEVRILPHGSRNSSYISLIGSEDGLEDLVSKGTQAIRTLRASRAQAQHEKLRG